MEPFQWCLPTVYLPTVKVDMHFANFWQVKIDPIRSFLVTLDRSAILQFGQDIPWKTIQKIKNQA